MINCNYLNEILSHYGSERFVTLILHILFSRQGMRVVKWKFSKWFELYWLKFIGYMILNECNVIWILVLKLMNNLCVPAEMNSNKREKMCVWIIFHLWFHIEHVYIMYTCTILHTITARKINACVIYLTLPCLFQAPLSPLSYFIILYVVRINHWIEKFFFSADNHLHRVSIC